MSVWLAMLIGAGIGIIITTLILSNTRNGRIKAEYEQYIAELSLSINKLPKHKREVYSRAVLKGKNGRTICASLAGVSVFAK
jgi:hypothetical protein